MKKTIAFVLTVFLFVTVMMIGTAAVNINTAEDLLAVMNDSSKWKEDYTLMADIDLTGKAQMPIGNYATPYTGHFDGNGFSVTVSIVGTECAGLFGVADGALIENLTVKGEVRNAFAAANAETKVGGKYSATGGVVGTALSGTSVLNCVNYANVIGPCNLGGVVGFAQNTGTAQIEIIGCKNYGTPSATYGNMGGVLGRVQVQTDSYPAITLDGCANYADITYTSADRARFGGIVGYVRVNAGVVIIQDCRNEGDLTGENSSKDASHYPFVSGIAGRGEVVSKANSALQISNCYNSGTLTSSKYAAGILGYIIRDKACVTYPSFVENCVNVGTLTGGTYAGGIIAYTQGEYAGEENPTVVRNCLNTAPVSAGTVGGILGRQYGVQVDNCVFLSAVVGTSANQGGITGTAAGTIACRITDSYYASLNARPVGVSVEACTTENCTAFALANMAKKETFANLNASAWTMGGKCPVPTAMAKETITIPEPPEVDHSGPQDGEIKVVFYDSTATNDNDGLTAKTPKMSFGTLSTHCYGLIYNGGTIVTVGPALINANYTFAKTYGPVTITAVWDGVDYRKAEPATLPANCLRVKSGATLTLKSELTFDNIILFQEGNQNTLIVDRGATLVVTDSVQLLSKPGLNYHFKLVLENGGTAILSKAAQKAFTIVNNGGTLLEYAGETTELRLTIGQKVGYVNGETKTLDAAPIIKNGRTMLPVRFVAENLGGTVGWDGATSSVTIKGDGIDIAIKVGAATAKINGKTVTLDAPAFIESSRTYLPVRVVAEAMGAVVAWDGATSTATLTK